MLVKLKSRLCAKRTDWRTVALSQVHATVMDLQPQHLESGHDAVYQSPVATDSKGKDYYWIILDVEDTQNHGNFRANIEAAQNLLAWLHEEGLTEGLVVILTGSGFRFVWPFLVPLEFSKGFMAWLNDREAFPMIDPTPQKSKNPIRVLGYRGHKRQNNSPKDARDVHTHVLDHFEQLHTLTEMDYHRLVRGRVHGQAYLDWLPRLIPSAWAGENWLNLLEDYEREARLKDSIFEARFPAKKQGVNWPMIWNHLDALSITNHEMQKGETTLWRLSECPSCGRRDGSPYLTIAGRLKCFHANSCEAGQKNEEGRTVGLLPTKWVPGYEGQEEEQTEPETTNLEQARAQIRKALRSDRDEIITVTPGAGKTTTALMEVLL